MVTYTAKQGELWEFYEKSIGNKLVGTVILQQGRPFLKTATFTVAFNKIDPDCRVLVRTHLGVWLVDNMENKGKSTKK